MNFDGRGPNPPRVLEFWEPGYDRLCNSPADRKNYLAFIDHFQQLDGVQFRRPLAEFPVPAVETEQLQPFMLESIPDVTFTLLHSDATPASDNTECSYLINNASIVLRLQIGTTRFLFTGDANGKERKAEDASQVGHVEKALLQLEKLVPGILMADVLKVPHQGSETASTRPFIKRIDPHFVIISASTRHELPKETVVKRYASTERVILRTHRDRANNDDHIVYMKEAGMELKCILSPVELIPTDSESANSFAVYSSDTGGSTLGSSLGVASKVGVMCLSRTALGNASPLSPLSRGAKYTTL